jgi:hypothetical protein
MGVPFGFSVGDLITGIGAMKMAIGAFSDTSGATNEYEQLLSTLNILSRSLDALNRIPVHPTHETEQRTAITQAVQNCQQCVNVFLLRITKYDLLKQPDMPRLWLEKFKVAIRKVQWVLCEKSEIARFRHEVQQQVDTINLLMATFHVYASIPTSYRMIP